jgi:hypothetical protein
MTPLADYIANLERNARAASIAEEEFRREATRRFAELERDRQYAFRRHSLMRAASEAVTAAAEEEDALAKGRAAFMAELGWTGATERQRNIIERFKPVVQAIWTTAHAAGDQDDRFALVESQLAAFEAWYADNNSAPFLALLEEPLEYFPLVEG